MNMAMHGMATCDTECDMNLVMYGMANCDTENHMSMLIYGMATPAYKIEITAVGISRADHATPSIHKSWH
jgi:hypothetical protein